NVFQHVALTYDKGTGVATLYCNGTVVAQQNLGQFTPLTSYDFYIGLRPAGDGVHSFPGQIDEPAMYNRALSSGEIAAIYLAGSAGKCMSVAIAPVITSQPTNLTVLAGSTAGFSVTATGTAPLSYQWSRNNTNLLGATNATLTIPNVQPAQSGSIYFVLVSNLIGSAVSSNAVLTVSSPPPPPACTPPPSGIVAWWQAEANGNDLIGGNNATLVGGTTFATGEVGQAFQFNGTNSYVQVGGSNNLAGARTIEAWVYPGTNTGFGLPIITCGPDGADDFFGIAGTSGNCNVGQYNLYVDHFGTTCYNGGIAVTPNAWNHVALVYTGTTLQFFVNGVPGTLLGSSPLYDYNLNTSIIGGNVNGSSTTKSYFNGLIDELAVYNRALSSNEIAAIYLAGSAGKCTPVPVVSSVPAIYNVSPASGTVGTAVTISGTNFSATSASNIVYFGAVQAHVVSATPTSLVATVPTSATYAPITVTVGGLTAYSSRPFEPTYVGSGSNITVSSFAPSFNIGTPNGPGQTVIADLDGDGKPDVIVADVYNNSISIFRNISTNGTLTAGSFAPRVDLAATLGTYSPDVIAVADVDGDGKLDIIATEFGDNLVSVFRNNCTPGNISSNSFATRVDFATGVQPQGVVVQDLDGDGRPDLVVANTTDGTISILRNTGTPGTLTTNSFAPKVDIATGAGCDRVAAGDLNGDGRPDLVTANGNAGTVSVLQNVISSPGSITAASFAPKIDLTVPSGSMCVAIVDVDGDNKPDLAVTAYLPQIFSVIQNLSTGGNLTTNSFGPRIDYPLDGRGHTIAVGDINGDGKPDLIVDTELNSLINIFQNVSTPGTLTSSSLAGQVELATGWNAWGVSVGDLDGDGRPDILFANSYDNNIQIYQNQTPFGTPPPPPPSCTPAPSGIVGWWPGEGTANDIIGGNNGVLLGGIGFATGEVNQGFNFNNTNAYVSVPVATNLDVGAGGGFTLEAWINPADVTQTEPIFEWNNGVWWGVHFHISPGQPTTGSPGPGGPGQLYANIVDTGGGWHQMGSAAGVVTANVFQHVALTYDNASGVGTIYCNGQIVSQANLGSFTPQTAAPYNLNLGRRQASGDSIFSFAGIIDEPSVYNRALSSNEIAAIYLAGSGGKCSSLVAPLIVTQPTNLTATVNTTAFFSVTAQGTGPLFYQWNFNGTNISGATNSLLTLNNVSPAQAGNYSVVVSNFLGTATSSNATLTVFVPAVPPSILAQTPSQIVLLGSTATFSVTAGGSGPLSYFWNRNNVLIPGATNSSYALLSAQLSDSGSKFSCLVTNAFGSAASTNVTLKVIDTVSNDLCSGAVVITGYSYTNVQSTVKASSFGDPVPDCIDGFGNGVWYQFTPSASGLLLVDTLGSDFDTGLAIYTGSCGSLTEAACNDDFDGVTSAISLPATAGTTYYFLIGGYDGHVGNLVFHLNYLTPPAFDVQPTNIFVVVSSNATLTTSISGTQPITQQWYFNNAPLVDGGRISGSTNPVLTIANINLNDGGNYFIVASNFVGVTTSSVAVLTPVILPPNIITPPVSQSIPSGSNVIFSAVVDGTPPYIYQWSLNGNPLTDDGIHILGSSTSSLTVSNLTTADAGSYTLTVTNVSGSASASATLTVMVPPSITLQPIGRSVPPGLPTIFNASASGIPTPAYQWQLNGTNIPGATGKNYTNPAVGLNNLGFYQIVASNAVGVATSSVAQLTFGQVAAWGRNVNNECLPPPGLSNVFAVAGSLQGFGVSFALRMDGTVASWGAGIATNIPASASNAVAIAASSFGDYLLRADGRVVSWGGVPAPALSNIVAIAAGNSFGYALRTEGILTNWGTVPLPGFSPVLNHVTAIACGYNNAIALRSDGTVAVSGTTAVTNVPASVTNVIAVAAGYTYAMALRADGRVIAWGSGTVTNLPAGLSNNIVAISAGNVPNENFGLAVRSDGRVVAWGDNPVGETNPPAALTNLFSIAGAAAPFHGLALVNDGSPVIIHPPIGLTAYTGRDVTLHGDAVGAAPLAYQWLLNGTNIPGATNTTLSLPNIQFANAGNYQLFVSNSINTAISIPAPVNVISNNSLSILSQVAASPTNLYQGGKFSVGGISVLGS
ncbi:MAG TPA: immunoglobulin domain-containing protein, partial [Candidatus Acidoferrales bacterium]|nr:immunoglobulin domain-containing protein [Candidatus Acidoferrales bacterium]